MSLETVFQAVGIVGILAAVGQLWEARRKRQVDMYWSLRDRYYSEESRMARATIGRVEAELGLTEGDQERLLEGDAPDPKVVADYLAKFHDAKGPAKEEDRNARERVRFLNQSGVLLRKRLVDRDLLFELIGPGLEIDYPVVLVVVHAYRKRHRFLLYRDIERLWRRYRRWGSRKHGL